MRNSLVFFFTSSVSYGTHKYQAENLLFKFFTDPLIRRFLSGSLFAGAVVWMAIYFFDAETEVIRVLAIFSGLLVLLLIGLAFVFSFVLKYLRRSNGGMLENIELMETEELIETEVKSERDTSVLDRKGSDRAAEQRPKI
jgi:hypothetical protein